MICDALTRVAYQLDSTFVCTLSLSVEDNMSLFLSVPYLCVIDKIITAVSFIRSYLYLHVCM